jgi:hypothetical protein
VTSKAKRQRPLTLNDLPDKSSLNATIAELADIADLPPICFSSRRRLSSSRRYYARWRGAAASLPSKEREGCTQ